MYENKTPIRILIADDEETDAFFAEQAFSTTDMDADLSIVKDGQEVIDFLEKKAPFENVQRPHIILLDIKMPRKDGHEALIEIKSNKAFADIPVIMLSSSTSPDDIKKAYEAHANAYAPKARGLKDMIVFAESVQRFWLERCCLLDS